VRFSLFHRKAKLPSTVSGTRRRTKTVRHSHSHRETEKAAAATRILSPKQALVASFFQVSSWRSGLWLDSGEIWALLVEGCGFSVVLK
jgi:hypothetical protein